MDATLRPDAHLHHALIRRWHRTAPATALLAGAVAACGFQPLALWPLTVVAVAALVALIGSARSWRQAALFGGLFGVAHFSVGNNWIATAFTYQANMPAWLGWIAVVLLSLYLAVYPMLAALAAWLLAGIGGDAARRHVGLLLAPCWIVGEWLRATVFTGFAWNPLGVALLGRFDAPALACLTPWIGTYGLSGLLVAIAALFQAGVRRAVECKAERTMAITALLAGAVLLVLAMTWPAQSHGPEGTIHFTLVQPDVRQEVLNDPAWFEPMFQRTARLSRPLQPGQARLVLWPESGVPDYLREGYPPDFYKGTTFAGDPRLARLRIAQAIGPASVVLTGAVDLELHDGRALGAYNSVTALDDHGVIVGSYVKAHLVPFGEYLALRWLLEPLGASRLVPGSLDFLAGPGPRTIDLGPFGRAGVQICYEITFSGEVVDAAHRPDYLFNPSNDGWFGAWGPPQHLAQARLRAIEEGLPVLRSTTNGISAVIRPNGTVAQWLPRNAQGRIDGLVPPAEPPTLFARLGNSLPLAIAAVVLAISMVAMRFGRR